jgi:hypothetical protein
MDPGAQIDPAYPVGVVINPDQVPFLNPIDP